MNISILFEKIHFLFFLALFCSPRAKPIYTILPASKLITIKELMNRSMHYAPMFFYILYIDTYKKTATYTLIVMSWYTCYSLWKILHALFPSLFQLLGMTSFCDKSNPSHFRKGDCLIYKNSKLSNQLCITILVGQRFFHLVISSLLCSFLIPP